MGTFLERANQDKIQDHVGAAELIAGLIHGAAFDKAADAVHF